ncbi:MAG: electron transfer flavoprotein subunit alpha/FixB family protein, partial [Gemmatimonadota bacterium]|nr:electron transfer flavoprotein subunit alpha/FixB family protein [Gemmatimonadota bacterium]
MPVILAVTEQRDGALRKVSLEVVSAARRLADQLGATVDAIVLAPGPVGGVEQLGQHGADRVLQATHDSFIRYSPDGFAAAVASAGKQAAGIVFAATATGRDLAPRVAARLGVGLASDVTEFGMENGKVVVTRPVYAGKVLQRLRLDATPAIISIRPNTIRPVLSAKAGSLAESTVPAFTERVKVTGVKAPADAALDVAEAPIVVSGGRGLREPEQFKLLEDLAAAFGSAAVGASRAVVDAGWRDHGSQVGQ